MATSFVDGPNGVAMNADGHESGITDFGHGHSRSQHRKAVPARTAHGSIGGFEGGRQAGVFGSDARHLQVQQDSKRGYHKHSPSLQLHEGAAVPPQPSPGLSGFANSPQIDAHTFPTDETSKVQANGASHPRIHAHSPSYSQAHLFEHNHSHSHGHSHAHSHIDEHSHHHETDTIWGENMASQDLRHITSDESSDLGRDFITSGEALAAFLIPLPFAASSLFTTAGSDPVELGNNLASPSLSLSEIFLVCSLSLTLVGLYGKLSGANGLRGVQSRKDLSAAAFVQHTHIDKICGRILAVALPFFAVSRLGSARSCAFILTAIMVRVLPWSWVSSGVTSGKSLVKFLTQNKYAVGALSLHVLADFFGLASSTAYASLLPGYVALGLCILIFPIPYKTLQKEVVDDGKATAKVRRSPLIHSAADVYLTFIAGFVSLLVAMVLHFFVLNGSPRSFNTVALGTGTVSTLMAGALLIPNPASLVSRYKIGFVASMCLLVSCDRFSRGYTTYSTLTQCTLALLSWTGTLLDTNSHSDSKQFHRRRGNSIRANSKHTHSQVAKQPSWITRWLLSKTVDYAVLNGILSQDDSRPVFYFMLLNFAFMGIQAFYSVVTGSLGLLSDSIHMFFDCFALALGLAAAVMSKWPPSRRFPYGLGMLNTLAGFGNGIFLMLISIEIIYEAIERMVEGLEMNRLRELFIISVLGMLVNLVGLVAVGHEHHHHGHSHGHSHGHGHEHQHSHDHDHSHDHVHSHHTHNHSLAANASPLGIIDPNTPGAGSETHNIASHDHAHAHSHSASHNHSHGHGHSHHGHGHSHDHGNENMLGIWLHIMADALGSLAVIVSTILIHYTGHTWWDPVASIIIAALIFASAIPLVSSCAKRLLLTNPESLEFDLKEAIQVVGGVRGVTGVCVPRFWSVELGEGEEKVHGVIHIIASSREPLNEVRKRAEQELSSRNFQVVVQVERETEGRCWCGGGRLRL